MGKAYIYNGKKYSNDYWQDVEGDYAGSLYDLLEALAEEKSTKLEQHTYTFFTLDGEQVADENNINEEEEDDEMLDSGYLDEVDFKKVEDK